MCPVSDINFGSFGEHGWIDRPASLVANQQMKPIPLTDYVKAFAMEKARYSPEGYTGSRKSKKGATRQGKAGCSRRYLSRFASRREAAEESHVEP